MENVTLDNKQILENMSSFVEIENDILQNDSQENSTLNILNMTVREQLNLWLFNEVEKIFSKGGRTSIMVFH